MQPQLSVVISTHMRPGPLRESIAAIVAQDLDAPIETIVVFDKEDPDESLESSDEFRPVRVTSNQRSPGLPGSRNTGVDAAVASVVGFCDDDDTWHPAKAREQLALMERTGAPTVGCAIEVVTPERVVPRPASGSAVRFEDLIRSRVPEAYMSTVLVRREAFYEIGPVDEAIPGGFAEDYDWWLRAALRAPVPIVTETRFRLRWEGQSYFRDKWQDTYDAIGFLLERYPQFRTDRKGYARIVAQQAFAAAGAGRRGESWRLLWKVLRSNPAEPRLAFAAAAAAGVPAERIMSAVNSRGRGI